MKLVYRRLAIIVLILCLIFFSGCLSTIPSILEPIIGTDDTKTQPVVEKSSDDKISETDGDNNESQMVNSEKEEISDHDNEAPETAEEDSALNDETIEVTMKPTHDSIPSPDEKDDSEPIISDDSNESDEEIESKKLSNQELIDTTLEYVQASNDFWEQGDMDNAIDALDKAYSLILKINRTNDLELLQQKVLFMLGISVPIFFGGVYILLTA